MLMPVRLEAVVALACVIIATNAARGQAVTRPNNVILFVPDGLRALQVTPELAPAMAAIRDRGVAFKNPHAMFPTFTMANSSALATGHYLGDTGAFSNTIYASRAVPVPDRTPHGDTVPGERPGSGLGR